MFKLLKTKNVSLVYSVKKMSRRLFGLKCIFSFVGCFSIPRCSGCFSIPRCSGCSLYQGVVVVSLYQGVVVVSLYQGVVAGAEIFPRVSYNEELLLVFCLQYCCPYYSGLFSFANECQLMQSTIKKLASVVCLASMVKCKCANVPSPFWFRAFSLGISLSIVVHD